jgi:hypothetical protein
MWTENILWYVYRTAYQVILGRTQWTNTAQGVAFMATARLNHPQYNPSNLNNDISLLRIPAVGLSSEYPS